MKKEILVAVSFLFSASLLYAQKNVVTGTVSDETGEGLPGASVVIQGTTQGISTDVNGSYSMEVEASQVLEFSFIGYLTKSVLVGTQTSINVSLAPEDKVLDEVVVTALGISREKRSLGYSTQKVSGDDMNNVKSANYVNSISGKASGVQIRRNNNLGGSTNIVIRGSSSLTGNNQALFVIDGVPISNNTINSSAQTQARRGYDYGNVASDINPDDIESINVLKGAAAAALYGSRAANGVVLITTKKGKKSGPGGKSSFGASVSYGITVGTIDESTFIKYQDRYGAGYAKSYGSSHESHFTDKDMNGDGIIDRLVPLTEDASYGAKFDPNLMVYQWDALYEESPNYKKARPWVSAKKGPITFFETPITHSTSVSLSKGFDRGSFRIGYSNFVNTGILPNSKLIKNNFSMNFSYDITKRLTATASGQYMRNEGKGRNSTGYSGNIMTMFRQWWQTNVDIQRQKDAYFKTKRNVTWNPKSDTDPSPIYWDNPYWTRYENYQTDQRNRFIGIASLNYKITDWLSAYARASVDMYDELREERLAVTSNPAEFGLGTAGADRSTSRASVGSGYSRTNISFSEFNYQARLAFDKDFGEKFNVKGVLGTNIRRTTLKSVWTSTNGGISIPRLYSIQNTGGPLLYPYERDQTIGVNGIFLSASLGYGGFIFLDGTVRRDESSTLPKGKNSYWYPSGSLSFVFSHFISGEIISFGKFRANYAAIGNSAPFARLQDIYSINSSFNAPSASVNLTSYNPDLKPELTSSIELGLEMAFLDDRIGFDASVYQNNTINQIMALRVTQATGYAFKQVNAGEIESRGIEISAYGTPVKVGDFKWDINLNWSKNYSEVKSLYQPKEGDAVTNYTLGNSTRVSIGARVGESYGVILGSDYATTTFEGKQRRIVNADNGRYVPTSNNDNVIGNITPDWLGGINNKFSYKNVSLSFLIDVQMGGDVYSLDMEYGKTTGVLPESAGNNELGNPMRDPIEAGGGLLFKGVNLVKSETVTDPTTGEDMVIYKKQENTTRINASQAGPLGYAGGLPNSAFVYDASFVKLREVVLSYSLPSKIFANTFINGLSFSFVGSNLWIIHKNLPYADPESGMSAGNLQGGLVGSMPTTRNFAFNVKLNF